MISKDKHFQCKKCGHTETKTGKIGNTGYDKVKKVGSMMSLGTGMYISCCASCGDVYSLKVEKPDRL